MSLPRYKITMLALSLGVASAFVGCSSNPSKRSGRYLLNQVNKHILTRLKSS